MDGIDVDFPSVFLHKSRRASVPQTLVVAAQMTGPDVVAGSLNSIVPISILGARITWTEIEVLLGDEKGIGMGIIYPEARLHVADHPVEQEERSGIMSETITHCLYVLMKHSYVI